MIENSKRKKLSLKSSKKAKVPLSPSTRFNTTVSEEEIAKTSKGCVPVNTTRSTGWALRTYQSWARQRNQRCQNQCPVDLFDKIYPPDVICNILQKFVTEARRDDGSPYPPKTLYQLLCGLLRHSRGVQEDPPNFLDRKDVRFKKLHGTCDCVFRGLDENGVGTAKKSAEIISEENENQLWETGSLNVTTPQGLQNAVFFYVGKVCCLRGGEEQRHLKISQFKRLHDPERQVYMEHGSKNRNGGFFQLHVDNKEVSIFKNPTASQRCLVSLFRHVFQQDS